MYDPTSAPFMQLSLCSIAAIFAFRRFIPALIALKTPALPLGLLSLAEDGIFVDPELFVKYEDCSSPETSTMSFIFSRSFAIVGSLPLALMADPSRSPFPLSFCNLHFKCKYCEGDSKYDFAIISWIDKTEEADFVPLAFSVLKCNAGIDFVLADVTGLNCCSYTLKLVPFVTFRTFLPKLARRFSRTVLEEETEGPLFVLVLVTLLILSLEF
mmetsp:Transcript_18332/g.42243  ORF Transcript_18332/g.42243 Transcript_18332/m.42243 type:complete len:213 (-) Transcript_18332:929-1567(-)